MSSHNCNILVTQGRKLFRKECGYVVAGVGALRALGYPSDVDVIAAALVFKISKFCFQLCYLTLVISVLFCGVHMLGKKCLIIV